MKRSRRAALLGVLALTWMVGSSPLLSAQETPIGVRPALTPEQMEIFLLKGRIISSKAVSTGVTGTRRATLSDGTMAHDASVQTVDISKPVFRPPRGAPEINFKDSYRYNIAGYRLARLLGLNNVPMSVERSVQGARAAVSWWVDDVLMDEGVRTKNPTPQWEPTRTANQLQLMRVFDELIANNDRNLGNLLWTTDGTMWMIDHTRAFRLHEQLKAPALLQRCERSLLEAMRGLSLEKMKGVMGRHLTGDEMEAVLARRDAIVKLFEDKITQRGEGTILYVFER